MAHLIKVERFDDGTAVKYVFPGGYPLFYITRRGDCLCPSCAGECEDNAPSDTDRYPDEIIAADANWENPILYCDACDERIESAYNDD